MEILKAQRQGNELIAAIPKSFDMATGIKIKPKLTENRIYYKIKNNSSALDRLVREAKKS